jgi:hypothetical protein
LKDDAEILQAIHAKRILQALRDRHGLRPNKQPAITSYQTFLVLFVRNVKIVFVTIMF